MNTMDKAMVIALMATGAACAQVRDEGWRYVVAPESVEKQAGGAVLEKGSVRLIHNPGSLNARKTPAGPVVTPEKTGFRVAAYRDFTGSAIACGGLSAAESRDWKNIQFRSEEEERARVRNFSDG